jgi:hypothetical protein
MKNSCLVVFMHCSYKIVATIGEHPSVGKFKKDYISPWLLSFFFKICTEPYFYSSPWLTREMGEITDRALWESNWQEYKQLYDRVTRVELRPSKRRPLNPPTRNVVRRDSRKEVFVKCVMVTRDVYSTWEPIKKWGISRSSPPSVSTAKFLDIVFDEGTHFASPTTDHLVWMNKC